MSNPNTISGSQDVVDLAMKAAREAVLKTIELQTETKYIAVNDDNPVIMVDEYFYAVGVGRNQGLKELLAQGIIKQIDDRPTLKAMGMKVGQKVYVPTEEFDSVLQTAGDVPKDLGHGRNTIKLLVTVPEGMDYLSSKVFTREVRDRLYTESWK